MRLLAFVSVALCVSVLRQQGEAEELAEAAEGAAPVSSPRQWFSPSALRSRWAASPSLSSRRMAKKCAKVPDATIVDEDSMFGEVGDTVPYKTMLVQQFSSDLVVLEPEAAKAWEILRSGAFEMALVGSIVSFVYFDKEFVAQTGGAAADKRAKKTFFGLWAYLTLAQAQPHAFAEYVTEKSAEIDDIVEKLPEDEAKELRSQLWQVNLEAYAAKQSDHSAVRYDGLFFFMTSAGQLEVLSELAWPVVRKWLIKMDILERTARKGGCPDFKPQPNRWACFAEMVGENSWVVKNVQKMARLGNNERVIMALKGCDEQMMQDVRTLVVASRNSPDDKLSDEEWFFKMIAE